MFEPDHVPLGIDSVPVDHVVTLHRGQRKYSRPDTLAHAGGSPEPPALMLVARQVVSLSAARSISSRHNLPGFPDPDPVIVPYRLPNHQRINPKLTVKRNRVKEALIPNRSFSGIPLLE